MFKILLTLLVISTTIIASSTDKKTIDHKILNFNIEKISKKIKLINESVETKKVNILNFIQTNLEIHELNKEKNILVAEIKNMEKYNFTIYKDKIHNLTQLFDFNKILIREVRESITVFIIQLVMFTLLFYIIYISLIKIKTKNIEKELQTSSDFDDEDTLLRYHKIRLRTIFLTLYFGLLILLYLIGNVKILLTTLSLVSAVLILGVREQLSDMIIGWLFNSKGTRNILKGSFTQGDTIEFINSLNLK